MITGEILVIRDVEQTCSASPSQWEARTLDNRPVYIRYRWGVLTVQTGEPHSSVASAVASDRFWFEGDAGDNLGGVIDLAEVCTTARLQVIEA